MISAACSAIRPQETETLSAVWHLQPWLGNKAHAGNIGSMNGTPRKQRNKPSQDRHSYLRLEALITSRAGTSMLRGADLFLRLTILKAILPAICPRP